jgi:lysophospholipase L1-like esterase
MVRSFFYLLFLTLFVLAACKTPMPAPKNTGEFNYLALGDSYTIGESVPEDQRWGAHLAQLLRAENVQVNNPVTIARTGWTTAELISAIHAAKPQTNFHLVSLLIGVNNQYRGQNPATYREEFRELLQMAIKFGQQDSARVIVLSIPDWGVTPFAQGRNQAQIATEIDAFNAIARDETQKAGVTFIDITPLTRQAATDLSYLAADGLHYSGKMHREWAELALAAARQILK